MATLIGGDREGAQSFPHVAGRSYDIPDNNSSDLQTQTQAAVQGGLSCEDMSRLHPAACNRYLILLCDTQWNTRNLLYNQKLPLAQEFTWQ